jgi:hypothetical protein
MTDMDKMILGAVLLIVGIAILVESLFADGIGIGGNPDFGHDQLIGSIVGGLLAASGLFLVLKSKSKPE